MLDAKEIARKKAQEIKERSLVEKRESARSVNQMLAPLNNVSPEVLAFMSANASRGIEDIPMFDSLPIMRVHTSQSTTNSLSEGGQPEIGQLYHSGEHAAYDSVVVNLLCIKKCQMPEYGGTELKAHYLVAGVINESSAPFVMYIKGMSYNKVWELQEQIKPLVKNKQQPIPLFALKINVYSEKEKPQDPKYAAQYVVKYAVTSEIETSIERLQWLKEGMEKAEMVLDEIIENRGVKYSDENKKITPLATVSTKQDFEESLGGTVTNDNPPF